MYAATGGPNVKWGGTDFKWGGRAPLPPAGDGHGRGPPRPPLESPLLLMVLQISASR